MVTSRGQLFPKGGGDDVAPHMDNTMTDMPTGPMTRSRAKAMQDKGVKGGEGPEDGDREDGEQVATGEVPGKSGTTGCGAVLPAGRYYRPTTGQLLEMLPVRGPTVTRK